MMAVIPIGRASGRSTQAASHAEDLSGLIEDPIDINSAGIIAGNTDGRPMLLLGNNDRGLLGSDELVGWVSAINNPDDSGVFQVVGAAGVLGNRLPTLWDVSCRRNRAFECGAFRSERKSFLCHGYRRLWGDGRHAYGRRRVRAGAGHVRVGRTPNLAAAQSQPRRDHLHPCGPIGRRREPAGRRHADSGLGTYPRAVIWLGPRRLRST